MVSLSCLSEHKPCPSLDTGGADGGLGWADIADYYSFVQRMKEEAKRRGVDLLLVDTGDRVDGNGLVDADPVISG